jgi:large subunit ribosomal protein L21
MYAIIKTGGKQYRVQPGDVLRVEKLQNDLGDEIEIKEVLLVGGDKTFIGEPTLSNAKVTAVVTNQARAPKVIIFKKKRRQGYRRLRGHRQLYTELFIKSITSPEGHVVNADTTARVFDPKAREARLAARAEVAKASPGTKESAKAPKKKAAAKKTAGSKARTASKGKKRPATKAAGQAKKTTSKKA